METIMNPSKDRVRKSTPEILNEKIDKEIVKDISYYTQQPPQIIKSRIQELDKEWDIERVLELNAGLFAFTGTLLAATVNKKWLWLPGVVTIFLVQHAIQGWCPPLPLFRSMHYRTRKEIDKEKYELVNVLKEKGISEPFVK